MRHHMSLHMPWDIIPPHRLPTLRTPVLLGGDVVLVGVVPVFSPEVAVH